MRVMVARLAVMGLVAAGLATAAVAAEVSFKPEDVVKARQGGMALAGGVAAAMKAGVAAGTDPKVFEDGAEGLVKWAEIYTSLYPDGTQGIADTQAKAEVWTDRAGFEKANAAFLAASKNLAAAAKSGDKAAFATAFTEEGRTCGGCHRAYKNR